MISDLGVLVQFISYIGLYHTSLIPLLRSHNDIYFIFNERCYIGCKLVGITRSSICIKHDLVPEYNVQY